MHPPALKQAALALIAAGHNDRAVADQLGIPRRTIADWRRPTYVSRRATETCPRCWRSTKPIRFTSDDYAELLAIYLGDGCISKAERSYRLRIFLDTGYPRMNAEIAALLRRCFPANVIGTVTPAASPWSGRSDTWTILSTYSVHLPCLFPQHGPGRKHTRRIELEPWQAGIVRVAPWPFIRGCIRTDGCSFINRTDVHRQRPYEYLSYQFSNRSTDIVELFTDACHRVGVATRVNGSADRGWDVRINRRESVRLVQAHVGEKG